MSALERMRRSLADLVRRIERQRMWRAQFERTKKELEAYSDDELVADLRLNRSDIPQVAAEAADRWLAELERTEHRAPA